jgi:hypothetical protein
MKITDLIDWEKISNEYDIEMYDLDIYKESIIQLSLEDMDMDMIMNYVKEDIEELKEEV